MDFRQTAEQILVNIGGEKNVSHFEHCSTRLRFTLIDESKINLEALKKVPGVLGVVTAAQCQVVIGNNVIEVYDEINRIADFGSASAQAPSGADGSGTGKKKVRFGAVLLDFIVGVFQPLVPVIAGAGILKSLLLLFVMFGWTTKDSLFYTLFFTIADAAFYFLPLIVAVSTATKLKSNRYVALAVVSVLVLPSMVGLISNGLTILGLPVQNVSYATQVFPALLSVLLLAYVEKLFNKISPKPIRVFFVPLMCFVIVVPITLLALGPLGYFIGEGFTTVLLFLHDKLGWFAVMLLAAVLPFMIATGMHKALVPYAVSSISQIGKELLYLPASLAHNISESGACFGVAVRAKDADTRSTAISAGISALFGITEPALYGLTIQHKRVLFPVMAGCVAGGAFIGITGVESYAAVGPGVASLSMFISDTLPRNIIYAAIGAVIAFIVAFAASIFMWKNNAQKVSADGVPLGEEGAVSEATYYKNGIGEGDNGNSSEADADSESGSDSAYEKKNFSDGVILSPLDGRAIPLSQVPDEVFSSGMLGDGVAVLPDNGNVYAPADATINDVFDSKHAISMTADFGAEILIHFGLETVNLNGKFFSPTVSNGEKVKAGQLIMKVELDKLKESGYNISTPVVIANSAEYIFGDMADGVLKHGDNLITLMGKEEEEK